MTIRYKEEIICPRCGDATDALLFDSLNATVSPEDKQELLLGNINVFTCSSCSNRVTVDKELLYHDMEQEFMAWYFPWESMGRPGFLRRFKEDGELDVYRGLPAEQRFDRHYAFRYFFDINELVRYIRFRDALADFWAGSIN